MTLNQEKNLYWPLWHSACRANKWHMEKTRVQNADVDLVPDGVRDGEARGMVLACAHKRAEKEHRAITLDDIRHAVHMVALKRDCSMKQITTKEVTRVKWALRLLIDPDDLEAMNEWLHPELEEKRQAIYVIKQAPEAYIRQITMDRWSIADWQSLDLSSLKQLAATIATRRQHRGSEFVHH